MADEIIIDGLEEHAFRRSIESMLRLGRADEAAQRLKALLPDLAGSILPARLLTITSDDLTFTGWENIPEKLEEYGRGETPITAIGIGICDPLDTGIAPDANGYLRPPLETTYYSDATFPFSQTDREDLLEGYSSYGCEWQGDHDRADHVLGIEGIDDLYGAIAALESRVAECERPLPQDIRAGAVGACYLGVLVFQAARDAVLRHGLPHPLAILLVNSDAYPFFDAPVLTCDEYLGKGAVRVVQQPSAALLPTEEHAGEAYEPEQVGSLVDMGSASIRTGATARKKMALALEGEEAANPIGMADDLVAEAAFNPTKFDFADYMPHAAEPLNNSQEEPPALYANTEYYPDEDDEVETDTPSAPVSRIVFSDDATLPESQRLDLSDSANDDGNTFGRTADHTEQDTFEEPLLDTAEDTASAYVPPSPAFGYAETPEPYTEPDTPYAEHDYATLSTAKTRAEPVPAYVTPADAPNPTPIDMEEFHHPAGHSIRSRIRTTPVQQEAPSALDKLQSAIAEFFKRIQNMLMRR